jgi:hypothetical protein
LFALRNLYREMDGFGDEPGEETIILDGRTQSTRPIRLSGDAANGVALWSVGHADVLSPIPGLHYRQAQILICPS